MDSSHHNASFIPEEVRQQAQLPLSLSVDSACAPSSLSLSLSLTAYFSSLASSLSLVDFIAGWRSELLDALCLHEQPVELQLLRHLQLSDPAVVAAAVALKLSSRRPHLSPATAAATATATLNSNNTVAASAVDAPATHTNSSLARSLRFIYARI